MNSNATLFVHSNHKEYQYPVSWYKNHFLEGRAVAEKIREDERINLEKIQMFVRIDTFPSAKSTVHFTDDMNDLLSTEDLEEIWTDF